MNIVALFLDADSAGSFTSALIKFFAKAVDVHFG
jgi:hypothetical protein